MTDSPLPDYPAEAIASGRSCVETAISLSETHAVISRRYLAALLDYAERPGEAMRWRPIESAPKDETIVDLYADGDRYPECWWSGERWISYCAGNVPSDYTDAWFEVSNPTHFMSLPPAPDREG